MYTKWKREIRASVAETVEALSKPIQRSRSVSIELKKTIIIVFQNDQRILLFLPMYCVQNLRTSKESNIATIGAAVIEISAGPMNVRGTTPG